MKLVIMRHGQTDYNVENRYTGTTDIPINATGTAQAKAAGCAPWVTLAYVSPLQRARQTARICFPHAQQRVVPGLREMDFGDFQGANAAELADDPRFKAWHDSQWALPAPHGESRGEHQRHVIAAVDACVREQEAAGAPYTLIVAHGGVIMAVCDGLLSAAEKAGRGYLSWNPGNCHLICADVSRTPDGRLHLAHMQVHDTVAFLKDL
ncbi:MAG: histidine phosphatase family protein [Eggerthellaceae bacterium]